jgi:hypothetical protein
VEMKLAKRVAVAAFAAAAAFIAVHAVAQSSSNAASGSSADHQGQQLRGSAARPVVGSSGVSVVAQASGVVPYRRPMYGMGIWRPAPEGHDGCVA